MARVETGDDLVAGLLQPGWKLNFDGYGLMTCTATYKSDKDGSFSFIERGSSFPVIGYTNLKAHKASISFDALGIATATVDYVGIELDYNSGLRTDPQVTGSQGLTSEHITTHPNFFESATGFTGSPIAGVGSGTIATPAYSLVSGTNPAEYEGNNGATFELATGRKFLGFKKPESKDFYGKTNYLAPQTSFSGLFYTTASATVQGMINRVGKTSGDGSFLTIDLLPSYMGSSFTTSDGKNQLLLAQVNSEDFGNLYKVQYEIRYNREGYVSSVYAPA